MSESIKLNCLLKGEKYMKKMTLGILIAFSCLSASATESKPSEDLRSSEEFVATCPEQFLTYIDKAEGGPGAYCACPEENISYIDKTEGGPGVYCAQ